MSSSVTFLFKATNFGVMTTRVRGFRYFPCCMPFWLAREIGSMWKNYICIYVYVRILLLHRVNYVGLGSYPSELSLISNRLRDTRPHFPQTQIPTKLKSSFLNQREGQTQQWKERGERKRVFKFANVKGVTVS